TKNPGTVGPALLADDFAKVESNEFHQAGRADRFVHYLLDFSIALRRCDSSDERVQVGTTNLRLQSLQYDVERFAGNDRETLHENFNRVRHAYSFGKPCLLASSTKERICQHLLHSNRSMMSYQGRTCITGSDVFQLLLNAAR